MSLTLTVYQCRWKLEYRVGSCSLTLKLETATTAVYRLQFWPDYWLREAIMKKITDILWTLSVKGGGWGGCPIP